MLALSIQYLSAGSQAFTQSDLQFGLASCTARYVKPVRSQTYELSVTCELAVPTPQPVAKRNRDLYCLCKLSPACEHALLNTWWRRGCGWSGCDDMSDGQGGNQTHGSTRSRGKHGTSQLRPKPSDGWKRGAADGGCGDSLRCYGPKLDRGKHDSWCDHVKE